MRKGRIACTRLIPMSRAVWSVCLRICVLGTRVCSAKTAEPQVHVGLSLCLLDQDVAYKAFLTDVRPVQKHCEA